MEWLIDSNGKPRHAGVSGPIVHAVWGQQGFIRIRQMGRSVIVIFDPKLTRRAALAGAFCKLADLRPHRVYIAPRHDDRLAALGDLSAAIKAIERMVRATGNPDRLVPSAPEYR